MVENPKSNSTQPSPSPDAPGFDKCYTKNSSFEQYPEIVADVNVAAAPHLRGRHGRQEEGVVPHLGLAGVDGALGHLGDAIGVRLKGEKL